MFLRFLDKLREQGEDELHAYIRGGLFPKNLVRVILGVFFVFAMLTVDWFGLLLINSEGVVQQIGILNALRVSGALMGGVAIASALLMLHTRYLHSYDSDENVFFAITFSLSFLMGTPCALVGFLG